MAYDPLKASIPQALDAVFSGFSPSASRRARILRAAKGETKVKKKLSLGLVLALILLLLTATATAAVFSGYFDRVADLEESYGDLDQWPTEAKMELIAAMEEAGLHINQEKNHALKAVRTDAEKERLILEILEEYYGSRLYLDGKPFLTTYLIFEHEWGDMGFWSYDQYTEYEAVMRRHGWWQSDDSSHLIPSESDISQGDAIELAKRALKKVYNAEEEELSLFSLHTDFMTNTYTEKTNSGDTPWWTVRYYRNGNLTDGYQAVLTNKGEMICTSAPNAREIPWGYDTLAQSVPAEIHPWDCSRENILADAWSTLGEIGNLPWQDAEKEHIVAQGQFVYNPHFCYGNEPVWLITFFREGQPLWKSLYRWNGEYLDMGPWGCEFTREGYPLWVQQKDTYYPHGVPFEGWSYQEQAAFSQKYRPIVAHLMEENPYFGGQAFNGLYWLTRHVYGVPNGNEIPFDQALQAAKAACVAQGAAEETFDARKVYSALDVTDPARPLWRMLIGFDFDMPVESWQCCAVWVDGLTGEVTHLQGYSDGPIPPGEVW